ncbi:preprotein translocase subunit YajC [Halpernia humi]|uniref:Sec translocon accessory complex subunit YajC n=1 Tax=Halpernia humi TaxID=493375 RepID=A0A1H5WW49_9FLAO|nr:preprotein translocase subunit YajC [Halpernia humi]SEG03420.1 preprotein translocase subunit YajC [Halpernia humi]
MISTIFLQAGGGLQSLLLPLIAMVAGFYLFILRPQMKKQKQEKTFQETIKVGSRVVMTSGIQGRIAQVMEDGVIIETMAGKIKFEKAAISREFTQQRFPDTTEVKK